MPADTLTGARLVEAGVVAAQGAYESDPEYGVSNTDMRNAIRAALRAQAEAAGVDAETLDGEATVLSYAANPAAWRVAALLRAFAEMLRYDR